MSAAPRVLLLALRDDWLGPPRLAMALRRAGLEVAALCPDPGPLAASDALQRRYGFSREQPPSLPLIQQALADWQPQRVLPVDDPAVLLLRRLAQLQPSLPATQRQYLVNGADPVAQSQWLDKTRAAELAAEAGLAVPEWRRLEAGAALPRDVARLGDPLVVKPVIGYGGVGVRVLPGAELAALAKPPRPLMLQRHIVGRPWACAFNASGGTLRAAFCVEKERTHPGPTGPSSRLRITEAPALREAAARLVARHRYAGFGSIDFMVDAEGRPWFLECNPRPTPFLHLGARIGPDPCAALAAELRGENYPAPALRTPEWRVALYPQEQLRDPGGRDLGGAEWDRPDDDPGFAAWLDSWLRASR